MPLQRWRGNGAAADGCGVDLRQRSDADLPDHRRGTAERHAVVPRTNSGLRSLEAGRVRALAERAHAEGRTAGAQRPHGVGSVAGAVVAGGASRAEDERAAGGRVRRSGAILMAPALGLAACSGVQSALDPAGIQAERVEGLWWFMLVIASVVFALVVAAMMYAVSGRAQAREPAANQARRERRT